MLPRSRSSLALGWRWLLAAALLLLAGPGPGSSVLPVAGGLCPARCTCDDEVLSSSCAHGTLDVVPIQLNPELRQLYLSHNRIGNLRMAFDFYRKLETLDLSANAVHTLGSNNFHMQEGLTSLNLSRNALEALGRQALHGLKQLRVLDLSRNRLAQLDEQAFRSTSELEALDLSGNDLTSLPPGLMRNLHRIRELRLAGNSFLELPSANLALVLSLELLDLAENLIEELDAGALPSLPVLERLSLANNVLRSVSDTAFDRVPGLGSLTLANNNLTRVPSEALSRLTILRVLRLSGNPLGSLPSYAFRSLFELERLELEDCTIVRIDPRAFADNVNLEHLVLDANHNLTDLPDRMLYTALNLKFVSLRYCSLRSLQPTQFPVDGLAKLRLAGNPLNCNCSVHWLWNILRREHNSTGLELDSHEIVCADDEFRGKLLADLPEDSLDCRLDPIYLALTAICCLAASAALLALIARAKKRRRLTRPLNPAAYRPELLVYVSQQPGCRDDLANKHYENRQSIAQGQRYCNQLCNEPTVEQNNIYESPDEFVYRAFPEHPSSHRPTRNINNHEAEIYAVADVTNLHHEHQSVRTQSHPFDKPQIVFV